MVPIHQQRIQLCPQNPQILLRHSFLTNPAPAVNGNFINFSLCFSDGVQNEPHKVTIFIRQIDQMFSFSIQCMLHVHGTLIYTPGICLKNIIGIFYKKIKKRTPVAHPAPIISHIIAQVQHCTYYYIQQFIQLNPCIRS